MQEEAEPRAFAASLRSDAVHAVVPVAAADERQAVGAGGEALVDRPDAVFEERPVLGGHARLAVRLVRVRRQQRRLEERRALVQHADVAGRADVLRDDVGQPQQIVGAARPQAAAARLVPPVLDVAFDELPAGGAEQMRPGEIRPRQQQRHHVLQLIAKAEGAARLVVARARPQTAADVLIEEPPVDQHVKRIVRRPDLDRLERPVPGCLDLLQRGHGVVDRAMPRDQPLDVIGVRALAQQEQDAAAALPD